MKDGLRPQYSEALFAGGNPELIRKANARATAKRKTKTTASAKATAE
jgi:hypothetical protein